MNIPVKKLQNGFRLPVLGFGTWTIGGKREKDTTNDEINILGIKNAINSGLTHIDTAEMYAAGHAEEIVGIAIKEFPRKKLFITTKVAPDHLKYDDLFRACENSLKRLQTDYLDLYLIHSPNDEVPINETMKALNKLKDQGLIKNIGVSNFKTSRLKKAQQTSVSPIVTNQVFYNLIVRQPETDGLIEYCQKNDILITAFRPVDRGLLTQSNNQIFAEICNKYQKTPAQMAINWLISQDNVVTISKMSNRKHLEENLKALNWKMEQIDIKKLRDEFPNQQKDTSETPLR
ncbi:aldo/keto reductase [Candidatus Roizmanbacteria bacterium]|nr:aldo/keto reductase [Candidatus Roizmanbacteria bacterium]